MKLSFVLLALAGALFTTACSQSNQSPNTAVLTEKAAGILGGTAVTTDDPISKSTVLLLSVTVGKNAAGKAVIKSLALCTGTILSDDIVLTAGHCSAKNPRNLILVFSTQIPSDWKNFFQTMQTNPLVRRVVAGVTAPNWKDLNSSTKDNWGDLSLLRFEGGLPDGFVAANLMSNSMKLNTNDAVTLAGFGETNGVTHEEATQLMKATVKVFDPSFSKTEMTVDNTNGKSACHGDSGGPAYVAANDGTLYLAGVTSRADVATDPQGLCVGKTIYTKVQSYLDWISTESNKLNADPNYGSQIAEPASL